MDFKIFLQRKKKRENKEIFLNKMSLNQKIIFYFIFQIIGVIMIVNVFSQRIIMNTIIDLEKTRINQRMHNIVNFLDNELYTVQSICKDYSNWYKIYEYANLKANRIENEYVNEFENKNFAEVNMLYLGLNSIIISDEEGNVVHESLYHENDSKSYENLQSIKDKILNQEVLKSISEEKNRSGIMAYENGLYFISINPIIECNGNGQRAGFLLMARDITNEELEEIMPKFTITESNNIIYKDNMKTYETLHSDTNNLHIVQKNINLMKEYIPNIEGYIHIKDFTNNSYINFELNTSETLINTINMTRILFLGILVLYIVIIVSTWSFLNNSFMSKINNITKSISKLKKFSLKKQCKDLDTNDELVIVENQIDTLVRELNNHYEEIIIKSNTDELTGLYNRVGFNKEFEIYKDKLNKEYTKAALLFLDIDKFKNINDIYGHKVGDLILIELANRVSKISLPNSIVARTSGDEFVIFVKNYEDKNDIKEFANNLVKYMNDPFKLGGYSIKATVSIGIAFYEDDSSDINDLMVKGDLAMYNVKKNGRNNYVEYDSNMKKLVTGISISEGIKHKEFYMVYQPQINPKTGNIEGVESLVRWNNSVLGFVAPNEFINIAEETGTIHELGNFIIEEVFKQINIWEKMKFDIPKISINISPIQLMNKNFYNNVNRMLEKYKISTDKIVFEITENFAIESQKEIVDNLNAIYKSGIDIYLDDFGKGYSALGYLEKLPISGVKIDKQFMDYICENDKIIRMIFTLSESLDLNVVAEGVENDEQKEKLMDIGNCVIQGYLYSKPISIKELEVKYM